MNPDGIFQRLNRELNTYRYFNPIVSEYACIDTNARFLHSERCTNRTPTRPSPSACQAIQPAWMTSQQARTARTTGGGHERSPPTRSMGCPTLLPAACKDRNLQRATDRSAKKSLCVLCALCVSVVKLLVVKL